MPEPSAARRARCFFRQGTKELHDDESGEFSDEATREFEAWFDERWRYPRRVYKQYTDEELLGEFCRERSVWKARILPRNEWIAKKTFEIWNEVRVLYGALTCFGPDEDLDPEPMCQCRVLSNGPRVVCRWTECKWPTTGGSLQAPSSAGEHIFNLVNHTHAVLTNRSLLPIDGSPFPAAFLPEMSRVHRLFFQVYAHAILHHMDDFALDPDGEAKAALQMFFGHWFLFVREFDLVSLEEMAPLRGYIDGLLRRYVPKERNLEIYEPPPGAQTDAHSAPQGLMAYFR